MASGLGGPDFSMGSVMNLTLAEVEEQLGGDKTLHSMDMEEILKHLATCPTLDTLPSFMRAPSWQHALQQHEQQEQAGAADLAAAAALVVEAQAAAEQAAAEQQQQKQQQLQQLASQDAADWEAAATAAVAQAQPAAQPAPPAQLSQPLPRSRWPAPASLQTQLQGQPGGPGMLPLASLKMDQIFSWYAENQAAQNKPQVPLPSMTLSEIFDAAGLHLTPPDSFALPSGPLLPHGVLLPPPHALPPQLAMPPGTLLPADISPQSGLPPLAPPSASLLTSPMHLHAAVAPHLPAGISPAGPFASSNIALAPIAAVEVSLNPHPFGGAPGGNGTAAQAAAAAAATAAMPPPAQQSPAGAPAARAGRAKKRKDPPGDGGEGSSGRGGGPAGPLSAAEAARQAKLVAERAAAELALLPDDLDDKDTRAMKRAIKNRESAARSRAKRQEYTAELEQKVEELKQANLDLRHKVITTAAAPPDPHAGELDGELMRRTRTGPF